MLRRKRPVIDELDEMGLVLDLDTIPPQEMSAQEYHDTIVKNGWYLRYQSMSGLTDNAWCKAMAIPHNRHHVYKRGGATVPDSVLNRAYVVYRKMKNVLKNLKERWEYAE